MPIYGLTCYFCHLKYTYMKYMIRLTIILLIPFALSSCVTKKKYLEAQNNLEKANAELHSCNEQKALCQSDLGICRASLSGKQDQFNQLSEQLADCKSQRDKQVTQVGD